MQPLTLRTNLKVEFETLNGLCIPGNCPLGAEALRNRGINSVNLNIDPTNGTK
jgi:hypothetical protein